MKLCFLGDLHIGTRNSSLEFHNYFERFFSEIFFPYLKEHNIKTIVQFGDLFDSRRQINFQSLHLAKKYFFDKLEENFLTLHVLLGNHCSYFKNSLEINSPELLLKGYENIFIHKDFTHIHFDRLSFDIIPWICDDNQDAIFNQIKSSKSKYCLGHFEIAGGKFDAINTCSEGISVKDLSKYERVFSGHFHTPSVYNNVKYLGTPYQLTWIDYEDVKGFYIFDTKSKNLEFIQNPLKIFHKVFYDDSKQNLFASNYFEYWNEINLSYLKNCYVKLIVINKSNSYLFDVVVEKISSVGVLDLSIVENFIEMNKKDSEFVADQSKNTLELLHEYIDSQEINVDTNKLKSLMQELYVESLNIGED